MGGYRVPTTSIEAPTSRAASIKILHRWPYTLLILARLSAVCYNDRTRAGGGLVQMLLFFVFLTAIVFFLLGLGYGLSWIEEERSSTRRYPAVQEAHYRRNTLRRRCKGGSACAF